MAYVHVPIDVVRNIEENLRDGFGSKSNCPKILLVTNHLSVLSIIFNLLHILLIYLSLYVSLLYTFFPEQIWESWVSSLHTMPHTQSSHEFLSQLQHSSIKLLNIATWYSFVCISQKHYNLVSCVIFDLKKMIIKPVSSIAHCVHPLQQHSILMYRRISKKVLQSLVRALAW